MSLNVELLENSLERAKVENGGLTSLGMRFYERLFEKYPQVKPLFTTPPEEQHKKLMASVDNIVASVRQPEKMVPYLHAMGIRHLAYKTENGHYAAVGENLVAVLEEHLSKEGEFSPEMKSTWGEALTAVSNIMIEAADNPEKYADELAAVGYKPDGFKLTSEQPWMM
jgi:hemoglobin-like flavoprotein